MKQGTIKIGRWTYPVQEQNRRVLRNTKRDGSGEWVKVDPSELAKVQYDPEPTKVEIPGFSEDGVSDYDDLRVAYRFIFDDFAVGYADIASKVGVTVTRAKSIVAKLLEAGLVVTELTDGKGNYGVGNETIAQSLETYDYITAEQAMKNFDAAIPADVQIRRTGGHGGKAGAQTRKPGKSTWAIGDKCPQGHTLEDGDVYTQPSGRKQCRKCRAGYPSNGGE